MVVADQELPDAADRGALHVRDRAVQQIVRLAVLEVDGVVEHSTGLGRLTRGNLPKVDASTSGARVRASVDIATAWPAAVAQTAAAVRDHVRDQLVRLSGLEVDAVDVVVVAVVTPSTDAPAPRRVQ